MNAPSYKRPNGVDTLKYLPNCKIWVDHKEFDEYKKNYPNAEIISCPEGVQGNLCRIRNYILDEEYKNGADVVVIIDDDLGFLGYFENKKVVKMRGKQVMNFLQKYSLIAEEFGAKLWGVNVNPDKQCYREYAPFSTVNYIGGPFMAHIRSDIRFDENLPLKEDYDITLQHLNKYRIAVRMNKFFYSTKQAEQAGGCAVYRNMDREKEQLLLLQKKWGTKIVKQDTRKSRSNSTNKINKYDINPIISSPIKGV